MARQSFEQKNARSDLVVSLLVGGGIAAALFVAMALVQMISQEKPKEEDVAEVLVLDTPPEVEEIEEEPPPPPDEAEDEPVLEEAAPQISLDQLEVALNPGVGGSLVGITKSPTSDPPTPRRTSSCSPEFPRRLKQKPANGRVVLLIKLDEEGQVVEAAVESSNLPEHDPFVLSAFQSRKCRFTAPTKNGRPVRAQARLPIPIRIAG